MDFDSAVRYVTEHKGATYAFKPEERAGKVVGGEIYILVYCEEYETDPEDYYEYDIYFFGGLFHSSSGEEDTLAPEDLPDEAKQLTYHPTTFNPDCLGYEIQIVLKVLEGMPLAQAIAEN